MDIPFGGPANFLCLLSTGIGIGDLPPPRSAKPTRPMDCISERSRSPVKGLTLISSAAVMPHKHGFA
jgi:hypothetical protein